MKSDSLPPLEWVRAFEAAARLGSFTAAANEAGLTQAAVSQRIAHLESHVGATLFHRRARAISLTVAGEAWLPHVRIALDGLRASTEAVFGTGHRGLTVSASQSVIDLWLLGRLNCLQQLKQTDISFQTMVTGTLEAPQDDIIRVRYGAGNWPHHFKAKLFDEVIVPVAAPSLVARDDDWTVWPRISCSGPRPGWHEWSAQFGIPTTPVPQLHFDTHVSALAAAREGLGVCLASQALCAADLQRGTLLKISDAGIAHHESYWILAGRKAVSQPQWDTLVEIFSVQS